MSRPRSAVRTAFCAALGLCLALTAALAQPVRPNSPPAQASPSPLRPDDAFGVEVTLTEKIIVYRAGKATWKNAFVTLIAAFKAINDYLDKESIAPDGPAMTVYTQIDDAGFAYRAALPVAVAPKTTPGGGIAVGKSPAGKALKFVHRGSFDSMDLTYEAIANYLEEKRMEAKDLIVEEYAADPSEATEETLVVNIFVFIEPQ